MRRIFKISLFILLSWNCASFGADKSLLGVFSNKAEGFYIATIIVSESGCAYYHAAVSGIIGEWSYNKSDSTLSFRYLDPSSGDDAILKLKFNEEQHNYTIIRSEPQGGSDTHDKLSFVTHEIPKELEQAFKIYPERVKTLRAEIQTRKKFEQQQKEKLAQEEPEYQKILQSIRENPGIVVSKDFFSTGSSPKVRAFNTSFTDEKVKYPEITLIRLLDELPPNNHWTRAIIFSKRELSSKTIATFYPKALKWGELNYTILANIAENPNTPLKIVKDIASKDDLPVGATGPAKKRLENLKNVRENK